MRKLPTAPEPGRDSCPFGPRFFLGSLASFVRDRCPDPSERLPHVQIHLFDGETLDVCHVEALSAAYAALAVYERQEPGAMRTEFVPFEMIARLTVRAVRKESHIGFDVEHEPQLVEAETMPDAVTAE